MGGERGRVKRERVDGLKSVDEIDEMDEMRWIW